jgi:hypothetical protein
MNFRHLRMFVNLPLSPLRGLDERERRFAKPSQNLRVVFEFDQVVRHLFHKPIFDAVSHHLLALQIGEVDPNRGGAISDFVV